MPCASIVLIYIHPAREDVTVLADLMLVSLARCAFPEPRQGIAARQRLSLPLARSVLAGSIKWFGSASYLG